VKKQTQTDRNSQKYVNVSLCGMHLSFNSERGSWACPFARLVKLIHHASKLSVEQLYINPLDSAKHPDAQGNHLPLHPKAIKLCACCIKYYNIVLRWTNHAHCLLLQPSLISHLRSNS